MVGKVSTVKCCYGCVTSGKQTRVGFCRQGFYYYEHGWSPIWKLVAARITYSQSHCATGSSRRPVPSHYWFYYSLKYVIIKNLPSHQLFNLLLKYLKKINKRCLVDLYWCKFFLRFFFFLDILSKIIVYIMNNNIN